jgi:hypothetical protein
MTEILLKVALNTIKQRKKNNHEAVIVFNTKSSAHPLTTSNSASLTQLSFGMLYHLTLSASSLDQFKSLTQTHYN